MSRLIKHYDSCKTAFFCCDIQEKLSPRIANFPNCIFVSNRFATLHNILAKGNKSIFIVTEQFPQGVGPTSKEIKIPPDAHIFAKTQSSMLIPEVLNLINIPEVEQVILWGNETHVCILQTAAALLDLNKKVVIAADGTGSQMKLDHKMAIQLLQSWANDKCYVSTSESIMMQLIKNAADPIFKAGVKELMMYKHPLR